MTRISRVGTSPTGTRYGLSIVVAFALLFSVSTGLGAQESAAPPPYHPRQQVSGVIRIWGHGALGHDYIESLVASWEAEFRSFQPGVAFDNQLHGTASAMGALYTHTGDIALMGREIWPVEIDAFEQVYHYPPFGIDILTGSLDQRNKDFALVVFTNAANPIEHFSLPQMEHIFGGKQSAQTWGKLGLTGEWADKPVHVYGFEIHRGFGYYMQQKIFHGSPVWNPDMVELGDGKQPDGTLLDAGQRIVDAIARDPYAVGYSSLLYKNPGAKPMSLGPAGGPFVAAS
ncbi:MAG TPA: hypothetical protein VGM27_08175, partial [Acidobacteriaceae bacterium]